MQALSHILSIDSSDEVPLPELLDPFARFVSEHGLRLATVDILASPRDTAAPADDLEWHTLVTLSAAEPDRGPVHAVFVSEAADCRVLSPRDVLWWLASDSWLVEQAQRQPAQWIALNRYSDGETAHRLFRLHLALAVALEGLLGRAAYRTLLDLYRDGLGHG